MNKNSFKLLFVVFPMIFSVVFKSFGGDVNKLKSIKAMQDGKAIIFLRHAKAPKIEGKASMFKSGGLHVETDSLELLDCNPKPL